jgi:hypothetical protein
MSCSHADLPFPVSDRGGRAEQAGGSCPARYPPSRACAHSVDQPAMTPMSDPDIIKQAYEDTIKKLYSVFYDASITAQDPNERQQAERRFKAGVALARTVRDRAIAVLP